ncbi:MAG: STAS domain-containing protein [Phycisphaerales bacterium]|jgi:anti-sigma B factor antagonist
MPTEWSDNIVVSELSDEPALSEELLSIIDRVTSNGKLSSPHVVLNFGQVSYINSSNLAQLLSLRKVVTERDAQLVLCSMSESVWSVFQVTRLDNMFRMVPDPLTALASLQIEDEGA